MPSYNAGRPRAPPNDNCSEVSQPGPINAGIAHVPRYPQPHPAGPVNYPTSRSRALSVSTAERTAPSAAPYRPTSRASRLSLLPRPTTARSASSPSPAPSSVSLQSVPSSTTADATTPSAFVPGIQPGPAKRLRNVLRRKAATIGKDVASSQTQKLSLVIPQATQSDTMDDPRWPSFSEAQPTGSLPSSQSAANKSEKVTTETPKTSGPAELASLRTIVDTQNLPPPPTPFFPSASTPSTRYSESPGVWSGGSTPTSLSSYSPGIVQTSKTGRRRQPSPSPTMLPVFTPPTAYPSPQSASSDRSNPKTSSSALPKRSNRPSPVTSAGAQSQPSDKRIPSTVRGPPHSPPPRKSSVNFSPAKDSPESRNSDIDVEKARKEVEEAERELLKSQKGLPATSPGLPFPRSPPRPSRDGTHHLDLETSPVIQSNLPYLRSTGHTRRESAEKVRTTGRSHPTPNPSATASVDSVRSKDLSRIPSRETGSPVLVRKSPKMLTGEQEGPDPRKTATSKRFGLFTKKSRPDMDPTSSDESRPSRKGPAAGTGHEGYGKYAHRGRKSSASSSGSRTRSTSTTRSASQSISSSKGSMSSRPEFDLDDFLSSRLEPVVISGGGLNGDALSRTQSEQSVSSLSVASSNPLQPTPLTSSAVESTESLPTSTGTFGEAAPSESGTSLGPTRLNTQEENSVKAEHPRAPKSRMPVAKGKTSGIYANPDAAATRTSLSRQNPSSALPQKSQHSSSSSSQRGTSAKPEEQQTRKGKTSRWNLFQRNRANEPKGAPSPAPAPPPASHASQVHAAISPVVNSRPVAHYTLVDTDSDELDDILKQVEDSPPTEDDEPLILPAIPPGLDIKKKKKKESILLPSPPKTPSELEKDKRSSPRSAMFNRNMTGPVPVSSPEDRRARRLASVGRIPEVVSKRDRQHRPDMQSFSRPFSVAESASLLAPTLDKSKEGPTLSGLSGHRSKDIPTSQSMDWGYGFNQAFSAPETVSGLGFLAGPYSSHEFLHFPSRKDSDSSSSSGALAAVTAVVPPPGTAPTDDEVWNEYDDLIDHVMSPEEPKPDDAATSKEDDRSELATMTSRALQDELNGESLRLGASNPAGDLNSNYGHTPDEGLKSQATAAQSTSDSVQEQQSTFLQSLATAPTPKRKPDRRKEIPCSSERDWDAVTRTNMRSASLMTSRWLSFGRVLFSPAHNHVTAGSHGRILVVDGLGNDDWSFYCSLTYPDAEVYSLSGRPESTAIPHPAAWQPPTNHHTVYHAGLQNPLPFPKDYFTVAALRFPAASPEHVQNNIIQECKRVLRSGGYLEMSLLDRDMVNMGARTRKAVRRLKESTCLANPAISLKPASDNVQRLAGTHGFDNIRRCMVRIPVAGMVVRSSDSTTSSNRSQSAPTTTPSTAFSSLPAISVTTTTDRQPAHSAAQSPPSDDNVSLGDLLSDPSPSAANDESITKIVARVGRWWYTKCYEDPVLPDTGQPNSSMWNDRKVLRECQKQGTWFRMLIAYAQKPSEVKRRTASV